RRWSSSSGPKQAGCATRASRGSASTRSRLRASSRLSFRAPPREEESPMADAAVEVDGRTIELSNLDKLLWPEDGITKADLIHYVFTASHLLLPHLEGRPLTVTRFPDGIGEEGFYQKDCPAHAPEWIQVHPVPSKEEG